MPADLGDFKGAGPVIGCHADIPQSQLIGIAALHQIWHLVQASTPLRERDLNTSNLMIDDLNTYIEFPISSILSPERAGPEREKELQVFSAMFTTASEKGPTIQALEQVLLNMNKTRAHVQDVTQIADEFFTNAIFNAPHVSFDVNGPSVERNKNFGEDQMLKPARLFLGADANQVVLGCEDAYGTLNPRILIDRLHDCFLKGPGNTINWNRGGAGIGTFMIFRAALGYYAGVKKGCRTVVCCTFTNTRRPSDNVKNIHLSVEG